tara:strand:- start:2473 stop:3666 length:1194 start_codon:yes stop_codon:yes gene_type:complete
MTEAETRRYTISYIVALSLIGLIALTTHVIVDRMASHQQIFAAEINFAGRQRMLVQQAARKAVEFSTTDAAMRPDILLQMSRAIDELEQSHKALISGDSLEGVELYQSQNVDHLYFEPPQNLDMQVRQFIATAREILAAPGQDPEMVKAAIRQLEVSANGNLAASLDTAVSLYEKESRDHAAELRRILLVMLAVLLATLIAEAVFLFRPLFRQVREQQQKLHDLARTDPLTGCHNRRSFLLLAEHEYQQVRRTGGEACVLMLDIDRFKNVNDTYGHAVGDDVIRRMAEISLQSLRSADIFGRLGGEEFCAILPNTSTADGRIAAEKVRAELESSAVGLPDGGQLHFTVSIGLAPLNKSNNGIHQAMEQADANLYHAKNTGRNRVSGPEETQNDHRTD